MGNWVDVENMVKEQQISRIQLILLHISVTGSLIYTENWPKMAEISRLHSIAVPYLCGSLFLSR
ncbi:hypothetical protein ABTM67_19390, partial [Acinetobacter baumannii]